MSVNFGNAWLFISQNIAECVVFYTVNYEDGELHGRIPEVPVVRMTLVGLWQEMLGPFYAPRHNRAFLDTKINRCPTSCDTSINTPPPLPIWGRAGAGALELALSGPSRWGLGWRNEFKALHCIVL
jgi:hypothetical protein